MKSRASLFLSILLVAGGTTHAQTAPPPRGTTTAINLPGPANGSNTGPTAGHALPGASSLAAPSNLALPPNVTALRRLNLNQPGGQRSLSVGGYKLNVSQLTGAQNLVLTQARALKNLQNLVEVKKVESELLEIPTGVLVNQKLVYKVKPGACSSQRTALVQAGVQCGSRQDLARTLAKLSQAGSERYIADPIQRQAATRDLEGSKAALLRSVAQTRRFLASADARRQLGDAQVTRLAALGDEDLAVEMMNAAETTIEEAFFIPSASGLQHFPTLTRAMPPLTAQTIAMMSRMSGTGTGTGGSQMQDDTRKGKGSKNATSDSPSGEAVRKTVDAVFLTGFTLGKNYEWRKRFSQSVYWCITGCKETYYAEPYVNLGYGLGLRFPIRMQLDYEWKGSGPWAQIKPTFTAFNGRASHYRAAGLEDGKLFDGKEIVAEYTALAGIKYKLPNVGTRKKEYGSREDFTKKLPEPYKNGQFDPPDPGSRGLRNFEKFLTDVDLLLGQGDYGIVGAKLFPGVKVNLSSDSLKFALRDLEHNPDAERRISSGGTQRVKVNASSGTSHVSIGKPIYNLSFKVTPGVQYRVFVDLAIWGHTWRDVVWIPELEIQLPPGGVDFSCHDGTRCSRDYTFNVRQGQPVAGDSGGKTSTATSSSTEAHAGTAKNSSRSGGSASTSPSSSQASTGSSGARPPTPAVACDRTSTLGTWSIVDARSGRHARGGVSAEGRNDLVGLGSTQAPRDPRRAWETFQLFDIPGVQYGRRIRNTIDGRWLETINNTGSLNLKKGRACDSSIRDMQWKVIPAGTGQYVMQNLNSLRYVRIDASGVLRADAGRQQAAVFRWHRH